MVATASKYRYRGSLGVTRRSLEQVKKHLHKIGKPVYVRGYFYPGKYRQTAGVWQRGILQHEYGVDLSRIKWVEGGVNEPRAEDHEMDLRPVRPVSLEIIPANRTLSDMLESGEIDAYVDYSGTIWTNQMRRTDVKISGPNM